MFPPTTQKARINTSAYTNQQISNKTRNNIQKYITANQQLLNKRIKSLDQEWDTERVLETNFAILGIVTTLLGITTNKKWLFITGIASIFLLQHALQGWCPPLPIIRKLGIRTFEEISYEKSILNQCLEASPFEIQT